MFNVESRTVTYNCAIDNHTTYPYLYTPKTYLCNVINRYVSKVNLYLDIKMKSAIIVSFIVSGFVTPDVR